MGITRYVQANFEINEDMLTRISTESGGKYFRATSGEALKDIYKTIDQMEKTIFKIERIAKYREKLHFALIPALILFMIVFIEPIAARRIP